VNLFSKKSLVLILPLFLSYCAFAENTSSIEKKQDVVIQSNTLTSDSQIENIKKINELTNLLSKNNKEYEELKLQYSKINDENSASIRLMKNSFEQEINAIREQTKLSREESDKYVENVRKAALVQSEDLKKEYNIKLDSVKSDFLIQIDSIKKQYESRIELLQKQNVSDRADFNLELSALRTQMVKNREEYNDSLLIMNNKYNSELNSIKNDYQLKVIELKKENADYKLNFENEVKKLKEQNTVDRDRFNAEIKKLDTQYDQSKNSLILEYQSIRKEYLEKLNALNFKLSKLQNTAPEEQTLREVDKMAVSPPSSPWYSFITDLF